MCRASVPQGLICDLSDYTYHAAGERIRVRLLGKMVTLSTVWHWARLGLSGPGSIFIFRERDLTFGEYTVQSYGLVMSLYETTK